MALRRILAAIAANSIAIAALLALSVVGAVAQPAPPATASASLTSTTCPGSGCVDLNVSGYASVAVQLAGTWTATVTFRGSVDGTNYQAINCTPTNSTSATTSATSTGVWFCAVTGLKFTRAVVTSYTSGTVSATLQAAASGGGSGGGGGGGSAPSGTIGAAVPSTASPVAGQDNSGNLAYFKFDASGNLLTAVTGAGSGGTSSADGATYTAGTTAGTPAMLARDDTSPGSLLEDKVGIARGSANRNAYVQLRDGAGNERGANVSAGGALQVDGSAVTQPVSAASLPLPAGASTAAKQPAFGTAGTPSADVLSVQGVVGGTAVPVSGTFWQATQPVSGTVSVGNFPTTASTSAISIRCVDTTGSSFEACGGGGGGGGTSSSFGSAVPATGTAAGFSDGTNMQAPRVFDADSGAGSQYVAGVSLRKIASGGSVEAGTSADPLRVDPTGTTTQPVSLAAGSNLAGYVGWQPTYGTKTTITWTGTSLANGSARESTVINWTSTRCADGRVRIQSKGQASGTNYVDWYVYTALGDTTYTDGATGSDAAFTAANRLNSRYLGSLRMNAATAAVQVEFQLSDVFRSMPDKWGLIGINNSGAALSATAGDHVLEYECVN